MHLSSHYDDELFLILTSRTVPDSVMKSTGIMYNNSMFTVSFKVMSWYNLLNSALCAVTQSILSIYQNTLNKFHL